MFRLLFLIFFIASPCLSQASYKHLDSQDLYDLKISTDLDIDKKVGSEYLSRLIKHINKKFIPRMPQKLIKPLKEQRIIFAIDSRSAFDGMFYPPGTHALNHGSKDIVIILSSYNWSHPKIEKLITHELFHAVHDFAAPNEESWVREGLAQFMEYLIHGIPNKANIESAFQSSTTSLIGDFVLKKADKEQYGHSFLFFYYLYTQCGGEAVIWEVVSAGDRKGIGSVNKALLKNKSVKKHCKDFKQLALKFELARILNSPRPGHEYELWDTFSDLPVNEFLGKKLNSSSQEIRRQFFQKLKPYLPVILPIGNLRHVRVALKANKKLRAYQVSKQKLKIEPFLEKSDPLPRASFFILIKED